MCVNGGFAVSDSQRDQARATYRDGDGVETIRKVRPVALLYHVECVMLVAWCELRDALRHFRTDKMYGCEVLGTHFEGESRTLRKLWFDQLEWKSGKPDTIRTD